ncbi:kelch domain-containing protein 9 [Lingula anatina]|uniref:Kelch domain-containing protein 9 n=1 Tax=Lingula anatina TaxID=7574 RepID=A0A1S3JH55_LINAN|nr:kelch domain-containing protein 9 [Lingula anatina]|eukprot:XP_013409471.2 kelch domain-containing protein 9 [Lingula anatina]
MAAAPAIPDVQFEVVSPCGPSLCHHVACLVGGNLYVHGGVDKKGGTTPCNKLYQFNFISSTWREILKEGSPFLSHHAAVLSENRYFVLIGGWTGKKRCADVHVFDTQEEKWMPQPTVTGFPEGAGLSSHTAVVLKDASILIIGREGSTRLQRKFGNAFLLTGSVHKGAFHYTEHTMGLASRSGHTCNILGSRLIIIGGRSDKLVDQHQGFREIPGGPSAPSILSDLSVRSQKLQPMAKLPCGRKHHIAAGGHGCIFIHGGDTFDGKSREPVGEMFLVRLESHVEWFKLGVSSLGREGHVCCVDKDTIFIHGGSGARNIVYGDLHKLTLK